MNEYLQCEVCGSKTAAAAMYHFFPPAKTEYFGVGPGSKTKYTYLPNQREGVVLCTPCVVRKRNRIAALYSVGVLVWLPLTVFLVGVFGLVICAVGFYRLRSLEEVGDVIAIFWRRQHKYRYSTVDHLHCVTRREFAKLPAPARTMGSGR